MPKATHTVYCQETHGEMFECLYFNKWITYIFPVFSHLDLSDTFISSLLASLIIYSL